MGGVGLGVLERRGIYEENGTRARRDAGRAKQGGAKEKERKGSKTTAKQQHGEGGGDY